MNRKMLLCSFLSGAPILAGAMLHGCAFDHRAWTTQDSWYNAVPSEAPGRREWEQLDRARIHKVLESRELQAEVLLQDVSIVGGVHRQAGCGVYW
jgi:hypothetical protein